MVADLGRFRHGVHWFFLRSIGPIVACLVEVRAKKWPIEKQWRIGNC